MLGGGRANAVDAVDGGESKPMVDEAAQHLAVHYGGPLAGPVIALHSRPEFAEAEASPGIDLSGRANPNAEKTRKGRSGGLSLVGRPHGMAERGIGTANRNRVVVPYSSDTRLGVCPTRRDLATSVTPGGRLLSLDSHGVPTCAQQRNLELIPSQTP